MKGATELGDLKRLQSGTNSGVYQLVCVQTGEKYVGSTVNLKNRKATHFSKLKHDKHRNTKLQAAYREFGPEAFDFEVLELLPEDRLKEVEQTYLNSGEYGYNISLRSGGGSGLDNHPNHDAIVAKMSASRTGKKATNETRGKMSAALRGRYTGEESRRFIGYFVTPWGRFSSSTAAADASGGLITHSSVNKFCRKPDQAINSISFGKSAFLKQNFDRSIIGKTWADIGFGFEPATNRFQ